MNDHELDLALEAIGAERTQVTTPSALRERVHAVPLETPLRWSWLPRIHEGGSTMFSALKFVLACVIVALFGSLVLAGLLTTQEGDEMAPAAVTESPSPVTTDELLSGMVTEEVEPGVFRVVNDGVRDLTSAKNTAIVAGRDGGTWLLRRDRFFRLAQPGTTAWPDDAKRGAFSSAFDVAADGTVWVVMHVTGGSSPLALRSYDDSGWRTHASLPRGPGEPEVEVAADGTVWVGDGYGGVPLTEGYIGRLDPEGWHLFEDEKGHLALLEDGTAVDVAVSEPGNVRLVVRRFEDGAWHDWRTASLDDDPWSDIGTFAGHGATFGSDGTVWAVAYPMMRSDSKWPAYSTHVVRLNADGAREWHPADGVPNIHLGSPYVGPDGSLWGTWSDLEDIDDSVVPMARNDGVARFDGDSWRHYLPGRVVQTLDIGADGSVWVLAREDEGQAVYVITPEAAAIGARSPSHPL